MSHSGSPPEFFIDRSLGRHHLANALRAQGLIARTMAEVSGEKIGQGLDDETWLADVGRRDWIVLMKDAKVRYRPAELQALQEHRVRAFCLTNANLRAAEQTERFVVNRARILRRARHAGPYIYGVYATGIRRLWPTP